MRIQVDLCDLKSKVNPGGHSCEVEAVFCGSDIRKSWTLFDFTKRGSTGREAAKTTYKDGKKIGCSELRCGFGDLILGLVKCAAMYGET